MKDLTCLDCSAKISRLLLYPHPYMAPGAVNLTLCLHRYPEEEQFIIEIIVEIHEKNLALPLPLLLAVKSPVELKSGVTGVPVASSLPKMSKN